MARKAVISVSEWSELSLPEALDLPVVKQRLLRVGATRMGDAFRQIRGQLYTAGIVGLVSTRDLHVQILPKPTNQTEAARGLGLLKNMLRLEPAIGGEVRWGTTGASDESLLEFVIGRVADRLVGQLGLEVPRRYFEKVEDLATIRGRVDLNYQAHVAPGSALVVRARYAPLQRDNGLSRLARAVVVQLLDETGSLANRGKLINCLSHLHGVGARPLSAALAAAAATSRFEDRWSWLVEFARLIVGGISPDPVRAGEENGFSIVFSPHSLFERALRLRLRHALEGEVKLRTTRALGSLLVSQVDGTESLRLEPDILVDQSGELVLIGDAKWRRAGPGEVLRQDAFQLVTYMARSGVRDGFLCYPDASLGEAVSVQSFHIDGFGGAIHAVHVDAEILCSPRREDIDAMSKSLRLSVEQMLLAAAGAPPSLAAASAG